MNARISSAIVALGAALATGLPAAGAGPDGGDPPIHWYYDAETALRMAERTGRPILVLKIRADIGPGQAKT